jgi:hypothetical protein
MVLAGQYLTASEALFSGLQTLRGNNDFHFVVTIRSFIEYTRRGIWLLVWATESELLEAGKATFQRSPGPSLTEMDGLINQALGGNGKSDLRRKMPGIKEPFINCLHALTHGNPISARMLVMGINQIFDTSGLLGRAEIDLGVFRILMYRKMLGQDFKSIWNLLTPIQNQPETIKANVLIAAYELKQSGKIAPAMGS